MKTALVTGAATGIGEGIVQKLLDEGWRVFAGYRNNPPEKAGWFGHAQVVPVKCDVVNADDVQQTVQRVADATGGRLDLLFNNAAYAGNSGVLEAPDMADYRAVFEVNFFSVIALTSLCTPMLKAAKGRVVNIGSASVYMTIPMGSSYPVAKKALAAMSNHLRLELAPFGVQVTTLHPGGVETPMTALGEATANAQWAAIPDALRDDYRAHFLDGATAVGENFDLYSPATFARHVYRKVITAPRMKPSYLIGPGGVWALPLLQRLLPESQNLAIWARMFGRKS